ncbi:uncharacterized protein LAESUDRAFT_731195 [Laetiporus sulphureus 93-53]|uniref:Uncharacterized protein n=1 Tax=Laetiporus sulphureus 93-53 TaxID=1314785 RepID=A0A165BQW7_9APHY|nr:uncharacterized protein LAESUDRAFT_731195 [Laetiporus sulphureus 93-53]KZT01490.1 hypothetical protein LAESUDRAFT_731195 [Laetiporus sulphureus 93-53]
MGRIDTQRHPTSTRRWCLILWAISNTSVPSCKQSSCAQAFTTSPLACTTSARGIRHDSVHGTYSPSHSLRMGNSRELRSYPSVASPDFDMAIVSVIL